MQKYIDREYYSAVYKGNVAINEVDKLIIEASTQIRRHTYNRATADMEEVKQCCCVIVDKIKEYEEQKNASKNQKNKKSESVGSWSVGYNEAKTIKELEKEKNIEIMKLSNCICLMLEIKMA